MREIKFRQPIFARGKFERWNYGGINKEGFQGPVVGEHVVNNQYTGFKDIKGKEIYEGDIIQCKKNTKFYRKCIYDNTLGQYYLVNYINHNEVQFPLNVITSSNPDSKIIGNISENPELLSLTQD